MTRADVVVVGGGIAGLACATELADRDIDVLVCEAESRVGGPAETRRVDGFLLERGPNTVRATPELETLIDRTGLTLQHARRAGPYLVVDGQLVPLPPSPRNLLRGRPIPLRGWLELLGEPFRAHPPGPRSVAEFVRQRLGPTLAENLADVLTLGSFGTTADRVGFESAFPELAERLQRSHSLTRMFLSGRMRRRKREPRKRGLISTTDGIAAIPQRLAERLGSRVHLDTPVRHVAERGEGYELSVGDSGETKLACRHLVLTLPPQNLAKILELPGTARLLRGYRSTPQTLANFAVDDRACAERWTGFGFLAPSRERLPLLGCLFPSALFPDRAPDGSLLLTVFVGPALQNSPDAVLDAELAPLLARLLGATRRPTLLDVAPHPQGITLYDRRHCDRTRLLRRHLDNSGGPLLAGAAYDGVAFGAAAASGLRAAQQLIQEA